MKRLTHSFTGVVLCLAELIIGILLLIDPAGFTSGIIVGAGWLLMLLGLWSLVRYFLMKPEDAAERRLLFRGLCALLAGLFAVVKADWILSVFPFLTMLYGLCVLLVGLRRVQWAVDMLRLKNRRWYWPAIGAALALAVAALLLFNPFGATAAMWTFTGVALIVEAAVDVLTLVFVWLMNGRGKQERNKETQEEKAQPAAQPEEA